MAAIIYRIYLFFSAVTPAVIYSVVAAFLVFLFSVRIDESMGVNLVLFFAAMGFTAGIRVLKDIWGLWPYAYHTGKFKVAEEEIPVLEGRPLHMGVLHSPYKLVLSIAAILALVSGGISYLIMDFALGGHTWLLWIVGSIVLPITLWMAVIALADNFFRAYSKFDGQALEMPANIYLKRFFIFPELVSFLVLNLAIVWPLHRIETTGADEAWVTMLVMTLISSVFLLGNTKSAPVNIVTGALFSKVWNIQNIDTSKVDAESPKQYQIWQFSFKGWLVSLVSILMVIGTLLMNSGNENWFTIFLVIAETIWVVSFLYLRWKVLMSTLASVAYFYRNNPKFYLNGQFANEDYLPEELAYDATTS